MIEFKPSCSASQSPRARKPVDTVIAVVRRGDCTGCTDPDTEGTHQMGTLQHPEKIVGHSVSGPRQRGGRR